MAIRQSTQSGNTHSAPFAFGSTVVDGDQLQITASAHAVTFNQSCVLGVSACSTHQARPTVTIIASGGSLPAGNYLAKIAAKGATGSSTASTNTATIAISAGQVPRITLPALPAGAAVWDVYLTNTGGATGTERRYAFDLPAGTFDLTSANWENGTVVYGSAPALPFGDAIGYPQTGAVTSHTGGFVIADGVTVTCKGDVSHLGDLTLGVGSILEFDASSSPSAGAVYREFFGTVFAGGTAKLIMRGNASSRAIVRSKAGTTPGNLKFSLQPFTRGNVRLDLQWGRFSRLGDSVNEGIFCDCTAAYNQLLTDVVVDADCGTVSFQSQPATGGWSLTRVSFRQIDGKVYTPPRKVCCHFLPFADKSTGLRNITACSWESLPPSLPGGGTIIDGCFFCDVWANTVSGVLATTGEIRNCFIRKLQPDAPNGIASVACNFTSEDIYMYVDWLTGGGSDFNPWGFDSSAPSGGGTRTHTRWTREYNGSEAQGDFWGPEDNNAGTLRITHCLVVPNAGGQTSGNLVTINTLTNPDFHLEIEHNTYFGGNGGIVTSEGALSPAGMIQTLQSNLCYHPGGTGSTRYALAKSDMNGSVDTLDVADPLGVNYNAGWNLLSVEGLWAGAHSWYNTRFSVEPGSNDVDLGDSPGADLSLFGPMFVDPTRNFITWAVAVLGASGTDTQKITTGLDALKAIADTTHANHVPGLLMTAPTTWVRAGWAPQNSLLDGTAHDGTTIGALAFAGGAPPPPSGGGARLIGIGCGRIAA